MVPRMNLSDHDPVEDRIRSSAPIDTRYQQTTEQSTALVLLSGGADSSACLTFLKEQGAHLHSLFIDYGQPSAKEERSAAFAISDYYEVPLTAIEVTGFKRWDAGYVNGRNAFLLHTALMAADFSRGLIGIGIHAGTSYADCTEYFIRQMQASFDVYMDGRVQVYAPFLGWTKKEVWEYSRGVGMPLELTYSCETGGVPSCRRCRSCIDRESLT